MLVFILMSWKDVVDLKQGIWEWFIKDLAYFCSLISSIIFMVHFHILAHAHISHRYEHNACYFFFNILRLITLCGLLYVR